MLRQSFIFVVIHLSNYIHPVTTTKFQTRMSVDVCAIIERVLYDSTISNKVLSHPPRQIADDKECAVNPNSKITFNVLREVDFGPSDCFCRPEFHNML